MSLYSQISDQNKINLDVRIISASNKSLKESAKSGDFRQDLYYRLSVVPIRLPPLRKRKDDIETKLETKPNVESGGKVKLPAAPRMGILDWIKNFIGNVLLGYFAVRLIKHLPKIMPILKLL